ncbi:MAG: hypothetical protein NWE98_04105 [Candidatus Bathyarchaeota archaeon]|nr:hypothetical protein [Candidatus Bathyarchaeota archaeon]
MTKSTCQVCGATFRGIPLITVKDTKQVEACPACYQKLDAEYRKNSCLSCVFFNSTSCELFGTELEEPYVQSQSCEFYTTNPDPQSVAKARIKKFEMSGRFEQAAQEYEKLGLPEKAEQTRRKTKDAPTEVKDVDALIEQLALRGQTLVYYCCHCGGLLRVGAKHKPQDTCPNCKYDLSAIDLAKLINQHL